MVELRKREVGSVLNYSAEAEAEVAEGSEADQKKLEGERLREVMKALDEAGECEKGFDAMGGQRGSTAFALKVVSRCWLPLTHSMSELKWVSFRPG